jgi:hypothetical protein
MWASHKKTAGWFKGDGFGSPPAHRGNNPPTQSGYVNRRNENLLAAGCEIAVN